ncbi:MAG: glycosyltransferase group 2 family protein [bacterium P3]|nr:MAG: glycosyltransferase group 2 family protein [bacterium P3]KWW38711.1 MAG: glycosyltransferase group 2 family protein [bacterium F083]
MNIAVVILNWNGRKMLEQFLPSVTACSAPAEVVIADNGSSDDSLTFLATRYPELRVIALDRNYGFAEGYNRALAQIDADYYVLLNDDVEVTPRWIEPVVELLEQTPDAAAAQPKMLMYKRRDMFEYAGCAGGYIDRYGYPFCRGRLFDSLECDEGQYDNTCDIFWASGAALFVKAAVWRRLGGLDNSFFAHMEEIDFCWRLHNAGYRVLYCPRSTVYHVGGGTLPQSSPRKTYLNFRNNRAMLYKNLPRDRMRRTLRARLLLDWVAALSFLLQGKGKECRAVFKAHRDFRRWRPQLEAQRRAAADPQAVDCIYPRLLLIDYHLFKKHKFTDLKWTRK